MASSMRTHAARWSQYNAVCREYSLRWFTPTTEVPLCGHATVATAAALLEGEGVNCSKLRFQTVHCGELTVSRSKDALYHLSVPLLPPEAPISDVAQQCDAISKVIPACFLACLLLLLGTLCVAQWLNSICYLQMFPPRCCRAIYARSETGSQHATLMCILVLNASYEIALFLLLSSLLDATHLETVTPSAVK